MINDRVCASRTRSIAPVNLFSRLVLTGLLTVSLWKSTASDAIAQGPTFLQGNVGINTKNPQSMLQLGNFDTGDNHLNVTTRGGNQHRSGIRLLHHNATIGWVIESNERADGPRGLHIREGVAANNPTRMVITQGRVGIGTKNPSVEFEVNGNVKCRTLIVTSDRDSKDGYEDIDAKDILDRVSQLPINRWHYKSDAETTHIGPVAQDFQAAFGVGTDNKSIATVDADGVALAAIKGLHEVVQEKEARIADLEARLAALEKLASESTTGRLLTATDAN